MAHHSTVHHQTHPAQPSALQLSFSLLQSPSCSHPACPSQLIRVATTLIMPYKAFSMLLVAAALLNVCSAGPVIDWLKNNKDTTRAAEVLSQLYPKPISDKAKFTLLVPTNSVGRGKCCWADTDLASPPTHGPFKPGLLYFRP